ncbi:hypothetical protein DDB_G0276327 [Dictyostelium discoideum AX4]|uniref:Putative uncharacterized protein DDB_G0276327 n=1 Tax=Dictyostelium discoideum TaxID=44689 RepID=Y7784_DICDI|nr:hypothetical protein DDB_G0276327 [Dictyostelium discoideum AX4]Q86JD9.2 RecName: Full=Putative uncharacterized protein DDB_G0276327 [Dictyostelium discoideum]EAL69310.1 hypothetical protein DDB_G0276327 [Dictyostelium discoideum AX4]|eukprot:XP_643235.1 hypothetical protein DDB_G0276327 [Dictyostelium discoideum AX4]
MDQFKVPPPTYAPVAGQTIYGAPSYNNYYMRTPQVSTAPMIYPTPMMAPPIMTPPIMTQPIMTPPMMYPPIIPSQPFMGPSMVSPIMSPPMIPSQPFMGPSMVSPGYGVTPNLNVPFSTNVKYYD